MHSPIPNDIIKKIMILLNDINDYARMMLVCKQFAFVLRKLRYIFESRSISFETSTPNVIYRKINVKYRNPRNNKTVLIDSYYYKNISNVTHLMGMTNTHTANCSQKYNLWLGSIHKNNYMEFPISNSFANLHTIVSPMGKKTILNIEAKSPLFYVQINGSNGIGQNSISFSRIKKFTTHYKARNYYIRFDNDHHNLICDITN